jgi:hypothetical protein
MDAMYPATVLSSAQAGRAIVFASRAVSFKSALIPGVVSQPGSPVHRESRLAGQWDSVCTKPEPEPKLLILKEGNSTS